MQSALTAWTKLRERGEAPLLLEARPMVHVQTATGGKSSPHPHLRALGRGVPSPGKGIITHLSGCAGMCSCAPAQAVDGAAWLCTRTRSCPREPPDGALPRPLRPSGHSLLTTSLPQPPGCASFLTPGAQVLRALILLVIILTSTHVLPHFGELHFGVQVHFLLSMKSGFVFQNACF